MIWSIIKLFGNFTLGVFLSFTIVAYYIYDRENHVEETKEESPFEDLYKYELQELQLNENNENNDNNFDCIEFDYKCMEFPSPYGMVYMKIKDMRQNDYDVQNDYEVIQTPKSDKNNGKESVIVKPVFMYYAKTSHIPYKYLDTLCRRYVIDYNIVPLYNVNYSGYEADAEETGTENENDDDDNVSGDNVDDEPQLQKRDSVFATLKTQSNNSSHTIIEKDINIFKYMGNLVEFDEIKNKKMLNKEDKNKNEDEEKLSYKEFLERQRNVDVKDKKDS